jgi:hypothetical protein
MKFSQRIGITPIKKELEREAVSPELRNMLWNVFRSYLFDPKLNSKNPGQGYSDKAHVILLLWDSFFKNPLDDLNYQYEGSLIADHGISIIRDWYFNSEWYEVLDFIEFLTNIEPKDSEHLFNLHFEKEKSAYRFIDGKLVEINSKEEVVEIENALKNTDKYAPVKAHIKTALKLYGDKKLPDYRNAVKEAISAVEALAKIIVGKDKATLGQALKEIEKKHQIPPSLKSAFDKLYGYSSGEGGIRHSLTKDRIEVGMAEARFMIVTCSSFVNYLILKHAEK